MLKANQRTIREFAELSPVEEYVFVHGADPQFGFIDEASGGDGLKWEEETKLLRKAVESINKIRPKPKFFFINGDLVNAYPGSGPHKAAQEQELIDILKASDVPVLVSPGNHDIGNHHSAESLKNYTSVFGDDYYSFCIGDVLHIVLNSQFLYAPSILQDKADEQLEWLLTELNDAQKKHCNRIIVFLHIPLFIKQPDEEDCHFNIPLSTRHILLEEFSKSGVEYVFSGHYHRNAGGLWRGSGSSDSKAKHIMMVVTSAIGMQLGDDQSGLSVVKVSKTGISQKYYPLDEIPANL